MLGRALLPFFLLLLVPASLATDLGSEPASHAVADAHAQAAAAWSGVQHQVYELRDGAGQSADPEASDAPDEGDEGAEQSARALLGFAEATADDTVAQIMRLDPVQILDQNVVQPVQQTAGTITAEVDGLLADEEAPETEMETQASAAQPFALSTPMLVAAASVAAAGTLFIAWLAGGSSSVSAAAGAKGAVDLRRLLPYASPLFTRFEKDTVLGHPKREQLYALVLQQPGVTLQDLCEKTNLSRTAVTHHLRLMEQNHVIVSKRVGRSRHFYENGGRYGRDQKEALAVLQNERSKEVAKFIESHPGAIQKSICEAMGIQASVAHWHVKRLQEANLVEAVRQGRTVSYFPSQPVPA